MPHFIQTFIQHLGTQCPFVSHDDIMERFVNGKLQPLLSNSIASLAVRYSRLLHHVDQISHFWGRFSQLPELVTLGLDSAAGAYLKEAKAGLDLTLYPIAF